MTNKNYYFFFTNSRVYINIVKQTCEVNVKATVKNIKRSLYIIKDIKKIHPVLTYCSHH